MLYTLANWHAAFYIASIVLAVLLLLCLAACILAPELADHDACKPLPGETLGDTPGIGDKGDDEYPRRRIDLTA